LKVESAFQQTLETGLILAFANLIFFHRPIPAIKPRAKRSRSTVQLSTGWIDGERAASIRGQLSNVTATNSPSRQRRRHWQITRKLWKDNSRFSGKGTSRDRVASENGGSCLLEAHHAHVCIGSIGPFTIGTLDIRFLHVRDNAWNRKSANP
jgi:hypothetical protein